MKLLLLQGLRHHRRHPLQTVLTLLGIAAGVALLAAMRLSQSTAERAFDRAVEAVAGTATHVIRGGPDGLPASSYAAVRRQLGGRGVAPSVHAIARLPQGPERAVLRVLGIDPFGDVELRPWSGPRSGDVPFGRLVTEPGTFVATAELLRRLDLSVGSTVEITVGGRPRTARCIGEIVPPRQVAAGLADTLVVDIATAQEWIDRPDRIDRLDLRLVEGELPNGLTVERAAELALAETSRGGLARLEVAGRGQRSLTQLTQGFRVNVTALSLLSLLVGAFLVHETMRLSVVARRGSFGVLRALGARGSALGLGVALEAIVLGAIGSIIGGVLGVLAAEQLLTPIVRTLNDHYATFALPDLEIDPWQLAIAVMSGIAVTLVAALGPAYSASRVSPREVLVTAAPTGGSGAAGWRWWWSLPPAAIGALLLATVGDRLVQGYFGMLFVLVAAVLLTPFLMGLLLRGAGVLLARFGPFARYVVRSTNAARSHLALPVAAMVLAVATTIGMAVLVTSFRGSVAGWLGQVLPGDVYLSVPGGVDERGQAIDAAIVEAMDESPDVAAVTKYFRGRFELRPAGGGQADGGEIEIVGLRATRAFLDSWPLLAGEGGSVGTGRAEAVAWISEPLAFRWGLDIGDALDVVAPRSKATLQIGAIYRDYANERGEVLVDAEWLLGVADVGCTALGLELLPGRAAGDALEATVQRLRDRAAAATDQAVLVRSQRELRETSLAIFDRTFAITGVMRLLCLAVAFFGIYSAFAALQLLRANEIGLLRCLGAPPLRIGVVVIGQTFVLGVVAALLAIPLGVLVGHLLAHVINRVSFGWSLVEVTVPPGALLEASLLAILAAVLAGIWPALRFAGMRPANALREG